MNTGNEITLSHGMPSMLLERTTGVAPVRMPIAVPTSGITAGS